MTTYLDNIVNINKERYNTVKESDDKVLIEGRNTSIHSISASVVGRYLVDKFEYEPIVVSSVFNEDTKNLFLSFGFQKLKEIKIRTLSTLISHLIILIKSILISLLAIFKMGKHSDNDFERFARTFEVCGINCGDLIYDQYVRHEHRYMNLRMDLALFWRMIYYCAFEVNLTNLLFNKYNVKKVLVTAWDYCYIGSYLSRLAFSKGIPVVMVSANMVREFEDDSLLPNYPSIVNLNDPYLLNNDFDFESDMQHYLKKYFSGETDYNSANAFKNKVVLSREELLNAIKLPDDSRKIVFVMPHCFSDAIHAGGKLLFRDYYDWLIETLECIKNVKNVIWVVRPHPGSYMYEEKGLVENIVKRLGHENVTLCPNDISTNTIFKAGDAIITTRGTIGIEAAMAGVLGIVAGDIPYGEYGLVSEPTSREEYFKLLTNIHTISKPTEDKARLAKKIFYLYHCDYRLDSDIIYRPFTPPGLSNDEKKERTKEINEKLYQNIKSKRFEEDNFYKCLDKVISES